MNGDSNFKTIVYNNSQKYKSAFIEKVLRENISSERSPKSATRIIDETKLKNLNLILSNLQYETIKKINEKYQLEQTNSLTNGNSSSSSSSNGTKKSNTSSKLETKSKSIFKIKIIRPILPRIC